MKLGELQIESTAASEKGLPQTEWSVSQNARRFELIDKQIQGMLTAEEQVELAQLTEQMRAYLDNETQVPLSGGRRLHAALLKSPTTIAK